MNMREETLALLKMLQEIIIMSLRIPVLLPGKSHGCRSLVGYSPWGHKESDMTATSLTQTSLNNVEISSR